MRLRSEIEWFLPHNYRSSVALTLCIMLCLEVFAFIFTAEAVLLTKVVVLHWLTLVMIAVLIGMPIIVAWNTGNWTLGIVESEAFTIVLQSNFSGREITEGFNAAALYHFRFHLGLSLVLLPVWVVVIAWHYLIFNYTFGWMIAGSYAPAITYHAPSYTGLVIWLVIFTALIVGLWLTNLWGIALGVRAGLSANGFASSDAVVSGIGYGALWYIFIIPYSTFVIHYTLTALNDEIHPFGDRYGFIIIAAIIVLLTLPIMMQLRYIIHSTGRQLQISLKAISSSRM